MWLQKVCISNNFIVQNAYRKVTVCVTSVVALKIALIELLQSWTSLMVVCLFFFFLFLNVSIIMDLEIQSNGVKQLFDPSSL